MPVEVQGLVDIAPGHDAVTRLEEPSGEVFEHAAHKSGGEELQDNGPIT